MTKAPFFLSTLLALSLHAAPTSPSCGSTPSPYRATTRHIEGKGIGYNQGYTSVDLFIAPPQTLPHRFVPFLDTRLHIFDNGHIATNGGVGLRYIGSSFVYGLNSYYDYRETSRQKYNQYSLGLEALGKVWDFRISGYLPLGGKRSSFYNPKFGYFQGNSMHINATKDFAMKGLTAEAGIHVKELSFMKFYAAFGPYYFERSGQNAIGGKIRASLTFLDHITMEGNLSYDPIFHVRGQGELSFHIPFGPKKKNKSFADCSRRLRLEQRAVQSVERQEIIPVSHKHYYPIALNPTTGVPYTFLFVDNTSHSDGTYESPYHTLVDAQDASQPSDVIYVFPGNGTDFGMDAGFTMKPYQKLLGSGVDTPIATQLGSLVIPAQSSTLPLITNASGQTAIVTMNDYCEVAGLNCSTTNAVVAGIAGGDPLGATFKVAEPLIRSTIVNTPNAVHAAIALAPSGMATLIDCQAVTVLDNSLAIVLGSQYGDIDVMARLVSCSGSAGNYSTGIWIGSAYDNGNVIASLINCSGTAKAHSTGIQIGSWSGNGDVTASLINCSGSAENQSRGIYVGPNNSGNVTASLSNCVGSVTDNSAAIFIGSYQTGTGNINASLSNCVGSATTNSQAIFVGAYAGTGNVAVNCTDCSTYLGSTGTGILIKTSGTSIISADLSHCSTSGGNTTAGILIEQGSNTAVEATLSHCTSQLGSSSNGIIIRASSDETLSCITLINNTSTSPISVTNNGTANLIVNTPASYGNVPTPTTSGSGPIFFETCGE